MDHMCLAVSKKEVGSASIAAEFLDDKAYAMQSIKRCSRKLSTP
jgi:hypothetical protein